MGAERKSITVNPTKGRDKGLLYLYDKSVTADTLNGSNEWVPKEKVLP